MLVFRRLREFEISMNPSVLATLRRARDPAFIQHYFAGVGIDICARDEVLTPHARLFPRISRVLWWDTAKGGMSMMSGRDDGSIDFVNAGHCLARELNPTQTLSRWLDLLKPGGYLVVTVPDEELYEKNRWPSPFDPEHRFSFTICTHKRAHANSIDVFEMVRSVSHVAQCERVNLISEQFDPAHADVNQAAHGIAECSIEIVLKKRAVPGVDDWIGGLMRAQSAGEAVRLSRDATQWYPYRHDLYHRAVVEMIRWKQFDEADALIARGYEHLNNEHVMRLTHALHFISRGKLQEGFRLREKLMERFAWKRRTKVQPPDLPEWKGEPLKGKRIVIWSEFGLGDEIFFFRFARILREQCGAQAVSVVCQTPLVELFEASGEADAIIDEKNTAKMPKHDFWVFPHAIPAHLPLDLEALPRSVPYLKATPAKLDAPKGALKVGIAFKGDPKHENDLQRSMPSLSTLDPLFALEGVEFYSVQKGAGADEAAAYASKLTNFHDLGPTLKNMAQTASVIEAMDFVVAVDTSIIHLAGALGKPAWLVLPLYGDWRWHYARSDSPWYPSVWLVRRGYAQGWTEAVERVRAELAQAVTSRR
jgi:SAM-dependent methyltransferase